MLREEAIKKHRAMWNWIAEQIVTYERTMNIGTLKEKYIEMQGDDTRKMYLTNNCYLCNYTDINCYKCPIIWPSEFERFQCEDSTILPNGYIVDGLYTECRKLYLTNDWQSQAELARKIANLPLKEE